MSPPSLELNLETNTLKTEKILLRLMLLLLLCSGVTTEVFASTVTTSGTFLDDTSSYIYTFTTTSAQNYVFSTSSFATGGFVPVLTLFNATSGMDLGSDGGDGPCVTAATCHDDASLTQTLASGSYLLYLTEFPNTPSPTGRLSDGFLFGLDPNGEPTLTGDICGVTGGMFLQTDTSSCAPRTANYKVSVTNTALTSTTPEPGTFFLVLPATLIVLGFSRRSIA